MKETEEETQIKSYIYKSIDRGILVSFGGGILLGVGWPLFLWSYLVGVICFLLSLFLFFLGRFFCLKFLFDEDIECGINDVEDIKESEVREE